MKGIPWLRVLAALCLIAGCVAGFGLMLAGGLVPSSQGDCPPYPRCYTPGHPYAWLGVLVVVAAIFGAVNLWRLGAGRSGHTSAVRVALAVMAVAIFLGGLLTAVLIRTSQVARPPCVAGLRERDCDPFTDYHTGLRWMVVSAAVFVVTGLLSARHLIPHAGDETSDLPRA
jgi:ABC-type Fe3+-siderophore transport system permease subunit